MSNDALQADVVARFGVAPAEARKMIEEAEAKAAVKQAVALASRGGVVAKKDDVDYNENPAAWRHELHRRLAAIEVMQEGVGCLQELQKHIKAIIEAEEQLIQKKQAKVRDKQADWWDLRDSGWAMGGRERFATYVGDIFRNLDEGQLGGRVMDRMGFKRNIPLPDIPEPVMDVPQDAVQLEAALVRGANDPALVKGARDPDWPKRFYRMVEDAAKKATASGFELKLTPVKVKPGEGASVWLRADRLQKPRGQQFSAKQEVFPTLKFYGDESPHKPGEYVLQVFAVEGGLSAHQKKVAEKWRINEKQLQAMVRDAIAKHAYEQSWVD